MSISNQALVSSCDVVIIGGGLSGKAASVHLAKAD
jgi:flavin-dependent dehydrogenase